MCDSCHPAPANPGQFHRRDFLKLSAAAAAALALPRRSLFAAGVKPKPENILSPSAALARLRAGNHRYVNGASHPLDFATDRAALATGQNPFAAVLSCADSRVVPEFAFDTSRGDLFVVRVAGNFLNTDALASFEYDVEFLGTPLIVVLGHEKCGAVDAAIKVYKEHAALPGHLPELVKHIRPAVEKAAGEPGDLLENAIRENVLLNVEKLKNSAPIVSQLVEQKKVEVTGGIYRLADGRIDWVG
jgi:carbonic anhydrase